MNSPTQRSLKHLRDNGYHVEIVEHWSPVAGYEGIYAVSDRGRVKGLDRIDARGNHRRERFLKAGLDSDGYEHYGLCKNGKMKTIKCHHLVAVAFHGQRPFPEAEVNHIDGDKRNNAASNLEWVTVSQNHAHAARTGLKAKGERSGKSTFCRAEAQRIRDWKAEGTPLVEIIRRSGRNRSGVAHIYYGRVWKWLG